MTPAVFVTAGVILFIATMTSGCGDTEDPITPKNEAGALPTVTGASGFRGPTETKLGVLKIPETAPGAPQALTAGTPTVKAVEYYKDWQLTKPLTGVVRPGTTFFVKVVFSEPMQHIVADDTTARPILYYRLDGELTRFRIAGHGASGDDFVSGDGKPLHNGTDDYICKYTAPEAASGMFTVAVGRLNADLEGNTLPAFYTHKERLQFGTAPSVEEVSYYKDWQLKQSLTGDSIKIGDTIYTKIVFSEEVQYTVSDGDDARPELYYRVGEQVVRHNIVPLGSWGKHFVSGDTKPIKTQAVYVGKYVVQPSDRGLFTVVVGKNTADKEGNQIAEEYTHERSLKIEEPKPPIAKIDGAPSEINRTDFLRVPVSGSGVIRYKYSLSVGEECGTYGMESSVRRPITADLSDFPNGELITLCVLGKNSAGIWQTEPTVAQWMQEVPVTPDPQSFPQEPQKPIIIDPNLPNFTGSVYTPKPIRQSIRSEAISLSGVTVTIMSGPRSGESAVTDHGGQYIFKNIERDELHVRVEKAGFESKEVIVHRSLPTTLSDGIVPNFPGDPQKIPGNILIGQSWPDEVRFILRQTLTVYDLLYVNGNFPPLGEDIGGFYTTGVVVAFVDHMRQHRGQTGVINLVAHEIAHAHQHTWDAVDGSVQTDLGWTNSPAGKAFAEARKRDLEEVGKTPYDVIPYFDNSLHENAAETCASYWGIGKWNRWGIDLKISAPNRFKWAEEWLKK